MGLALIVLLALAVFVALTYNSLARLRLLASNAWADIDVQLKRRHDLIPALVAAVKGHAGYEKSTLESVVEARNRAASAAGPAAAGETEGALAACGGRTRPTATATPTACWRGRVAFVTRSSPAPS